MSSSGSSGAKTVALSEVDPWELRRMSADEGGRPFNVQRERFGLPQDPPEGDQGRDGPERALAEQGGLPSLETKSITAETDPGVMEGDEEAAMGGKLQVRDRLPCSLQPPGCHAYAARIVADGEIGSCGLLASSTSMHDNTRRMLPRVLPALPRMGKMLPAIPSVQLRSVDGRWQAAEITNCMHACLLWSWHACAQ